METTTGQQKHLHMTKCFSIDEDPIDVDNSFVDTYNKQNIEIPAEPEIADLRLTINNPPNLLDTGQNDCEKLKIRYKRQQISISDCFSPVTLHLDTIKAREPEEVADEGTIEDNHVEDEEPGDELTSFKGEEDNHDNCQPLRPTESGEREPDETEDFPAALEAGKLICRDQVEDILPAEHDDHGDESCSNLLAGGAEKEVDEDDPEIDDAFFALDSCCKPAGTNVANPASSLLNLEEDGAQFFSEEGATCTTAILSMDGELSDSGEEDGDDKCKNSAEEAISLQQEVHGEDYIEVEDDTDEAFDLQVELQHVQEEPADKETSDALQRASTTEESLVLEKLLGGLQHLKCDKDQEGSDFEDGLGQHYLHYLATDPELLRITIKHLENIKNGKADKKQSTIFPEVVWKDDNITPAGVNIQVYPCKISPKQEREVDSSYSSEEEAEDSQETPISPSGASGGNPMLFARTDNPVLPAMLRGASHLQLTRQEGVGILQSRIAPPLRLSESSLMGQGTRMHDARLALNKQTPTSLLSVRFPLDRPQTRSPVIYGQRAHLLEQAREWKESRDDNPPSQAPMPDLLRGVIFQNSDLIINSQGRYARDQDWKFWTTTCLGSGMGGTVYRATDNSTKKTFAVKLIEKLNFRVEELQALCTLGHPNIIQLYGAVANHSRVHLFTEFVNGPTLKEWIAICGQLDLWTSLTYYGKMVRVLEYLESHHIYHEDLKADNWVLVGNCFDIKLVDFGLAHMVIQPPHRMEANVHPRGAPTHCSPEKAGCLGYNHRSELWSANVTFVHMLNGTAPWLRRFQHLNSIFEVIARQSPPVEDVPVNLPTVVHEMILLGFTVNPIHRPSASEMLAHEAFGLLDKYHAAHDIFYGHIRESNRQVENQGWQLHDISNSDETPTDAAVDIENRGEPPDIIQPRINTPQIEPPYNQIYMGKPPSFLVGPAMQPESHGIQMRRTTSTTRTTNSSNHVQGHTSSYEHQVPLTAAPTNMQLTRVSVHGSESPPPVLPNLPIFDADGHQNQDHEDDDKSPTADGEPSCFAAEEDEIAAAVTETAQSMSNVESLSLSVTLADVIYTQQEPQFAMQASSPLAVPRGPDLTDQSGIALCYGDVSQNEIVGTRTAVAVQSSHAASPTSSSDSHLSRATFSCGNSRGSDPSSTLSNLFDEDPMNLVCQETRDDLARQMEQMEDDKYDVRLRFVNVDGELLGKEWRICLVYQYLWRRVIEEGAAAAMHSAGFQRFSLRDEQGSQVSLSPESTVGMTLDKVEPADSVLDITVVEVKDDIVDWFVENGDIKHVKRE